MNYRRAIVPFFYLLIPFFYPLTLWSLTLCEIEQNSAKQLLQSPWIDQEVELKGFLYRVEDRWVLARQPNLKSCCICLAKVILTGEQLASSDKVVKVRGKFSVQHSCSGREEDVLVHLTECRIVKE